MHDYDIDWRDLEDRDEKIAALAKALEEIRNLPFGAWDKTMREIATRGLDEAGMLS